MRVYRETCGTFYPGVRMFVRVLVRVSGGSVRTLFLRVGSRGFRGSRGSPRFLVPAKQQWAVRGLIYCLDCSFIFRIICLLILFLLSSVYYLLCTISIVYRSNFVYEITVCVKNILFYFICQKPPKPG